MLKERIRTDCGNGDNCSQVILRAVAEEYGISLSEELFCACRGIHGGFGINGMCSGIVAGVMALGLLCEEEELKLKRADFLDLGNHLFCGVRDFIAYNGESEIAQIVD